ncbi:hypothetical protein AWV72_00504 [Lactiplantibacillus plantarum]|nr:hypothetical protein AWV72_00504 [Lactiplantibacillus plantarum]
MWEESNHESINDGIGTSVLSVPTGGTTTADVDVLTGVWLGRH